MEKRKARRMEETWQMVGNTPVFMWENLDVAYMNGPENIGLTLMEDRQTPISLNTGCSITMARENQTSG